MEKENAERKLRSPNYPALGLAEAVRLARLLFDRERRTFVAPDVAVKPWGHEKLSGTARIKLAAVKKYGLLDEEKGGIRVSQLALDIFQHDPTSWDYIQAVRRAAMTPELFKSLAVNFLHGSDDALKRELMFKKGFLEDGAVTAIRAFRDTVRLAKLDDPDYIPEHEPPNSLLDTGQSGDGRSGAVNTGEATPAKPSPQPPPPPQGVKVFSWPLSKGVTAEVRFSGADIGPEHLERLRKYLELAKDAMADEEAPPPA